jgi:hypothetical protein
MNLFTYFELKTAKLNKKLLQKISSKENKRIQKQSYEQKEEKIWSKVGKYNKQFRVLFERDRINKAFRDVLQNNFPDFEEDDVVYNVSFLPMAGNFTDITAHNDLGKFFTKIGLEIIKVSKETGARFFKFTATKTPFEEKAKVRNMLYARILRSVGIEAKNIGENSNDEDVFMFKVPEIKS